MLRVLPAGGSPSLLLLFLLCFRVDMKHRFRRDLAKGEAESSMSQQRLQHRMREQSVIHTTQHNTHTGQHHTDPRHVNVCQVCQVNGRNAVVGGAWAAEKEEKEEDGR